MLGFSHPQLRAFSKRAAQIEAELEKSGALYASPALRMRADDEASLATRTAKDHSLTPTLLHRRWQEEAVAAGLATGEDLEEAVCWQEVALAPLPEEDVVAALVGPEVGLCSRSARFTRADVVEHVCALTGGRLSVEEVVALTDRFVTSEAVVRLTPGADGGSRRPEQWSTAAHRAMEDRALALVGSLSARPVPALDGAGVQAALAAVPELGEDQVAAVRVLAGQGAALRAVLAPAGYGKTTMLHTAARAAAADGRPVVAVATTAKAVSELAGAGLDARTIARLRVDLANGPLAAGTVVVLDEISQAPTHEVEAVLAAVDACPGGTLWVLGDPRQSQPVGAGGMADHLEGLVTTGAIASARLTVNRRQTDPADREALGLLRQGDATGSQSLRAENGWEHEHKSPAEAREAMAQAVCDDIGRYGAGQVVALVVSHADAEDIADRVRDRLASAGQLGGPVVTGPGWTGEREYQAGDRVLLHARCGPSASSLVNGTAATVTRVDGEGLEVRLDGRGTMASLPTAFVQGTRKDGSPNLSHAWARTVDGAQGGTWEAAHLLGNSALDAYRGYTGQSRSRQPAHTWNTARVAPADHGGGLADRRSPAELVAQALARQADPTLAARSDPWVLDRRLREQIAEHERVLAARPPDRREALAEATRELEMAQGWWANMEAVATETARQLGAMSQFAGLSPRGRAERRRLQDKLACDTVRAGAAKESCDELETQAGRLRKEQGALERFEAAEGWRRDEVPRLQDQLDHHWAEVVAACVNADDPLAFGTDKLRHARATVALDLQRLADAAPPDREGEREQARQELGDTLGRATTPKPRWPPAAPSSPTPAGVDGDDATVRRSPPPKVASESLNNDWARTWRPRTLFGTAWPLSPATRKNVRRPSLVRRLGVGNWGQRWRSSTPPSTARAPTGPWRSSTDRLRTWSRRSANHHAQPRAGPCGAITPSGSRRRSTAMTLSARPGRSGACRPGWCGSRSPWRTAGSRPPPPLGQPSGPPSQARQPACASTYSAAPGPGRWPSRC